MSIAGYLRSRLRRIASAREKKKLLLQNAPEDLPRSEWSKSLLDPTSFYFDCFRFFHQRLPADLQNHREYFSRNGRGFGEDAFHVMWYLLFREFKPANFLEIGVFRGQTLSLAALLSRRSKSPCVVQGISPFSSAGDSVSRYGTDVDYYRDTLNNFEHFGLPHPGLLKAYSTDSQARDLIGSTEWHMVYIDGNHDYEIARQDWEHCVTNLKREGVIVLDDSGLTTPFCPPAFATAGHPGPSRVAQEIDRLHFRELLQVGHNRVFQKIA